MAQANSDIAIAITHIATEVIVDRSVVCPFVRLSLSVCPCRSDWKTKPTVKICIANCGQAVGDSGIVIIDSLQELDNALSNGTIADHIRLPLPK